LDGRLVIRLKVCCGNYGFMRIMARKSCVGFAVFLAFIGVLAGYFYDSQVNMRSWLITDHVTDDVLITIDSYGMPFIEASSNTDAVFAIGVVQASTRLWQIDVARRVSSGRLSEIVGSAAYETDEFFRTLGINRIAARNWAAYTPEERELLQTFSDGFNYAVDQMRFLPIEYYLTWTSWESYHPTDTIAQLSFSTYILSPGWAKELLREYLVEAVGDEAANILLPFELKNIRPPTYIIGEEELLEGLKQPAAEKPATRSSGPHLKEGFEEAFSVKQDLESPVLASNSWVVSGKHTRSGKPMLANDPHLPMTMPSFLIFMDIKGHCALERRHCPWDFHLH
jgi:penicillin amidase